MFTIPYFFGCHLVKTIGKAKRLSIILSYFRFNCTGRQNVSQGVHHSHLDSESSPGHNNDGKLPNFNLLHLYIGSTRRWFVQMSLLLPGKNWVRLPDGEMELDVEGGREIVDSTNGMRIRASLYSPVHCSATFHDPSVTSAQTNACCAGYIL